VSVDVLAHENVLYTDNTFTKWSMQNTAHVYKFWNINAKKCC